MEPIPIETLDESATTWGRLALAGDLEGAIVEYIRQMDHVSFAELQRHLGAFVEIQGDLTMYIAPHIMVWGGMSDRFAQAVDSLLKQRRVFLHPTLWLTYLIDGCVPLLPVARRPPRAGYKADHWLPCVLRLVPPSERRARSRR